MARQSLVGKSTMGPSPFETRQVKARVLSTATKVSIRVSSGECTFNPIKFNGFTVGPISIEAEFNAGVDIDAAIVEMDQVVSRHYDELYRIQLRRYLQSLKANEREVEDARG